MIGRLRGTVVARYADRVVVDVGGTGYDVATTPRALAELPGIGEEAVVHTHLHVREDALALYGFATDHDRDLFRLLIGVSGVGPKVALAILATLTPDQLRAAVVAEDLAALTSVPGIGKRSAQKLLLELRPKLDVPDGSVPGAASSAAEVREALEQLGYGPAEIREAMAGHDSDLAVEELLRQSLRRLGAGTT